MKHNTKRKGFTIVELVIVIAVIAILATALVPTFGDVISNAKDTAAKQEAKNAHTGYMVENAGKGEMPELFLYIAEENRVVAIQNGVAVGIYATREEALTALIGEEYDLNELADTGDGKFFAYGGEKIKKAVICFTIDDALSTDTVMYETFKKYGLVCNFALPTNSAASKYQQYLNYQSEGFEIISHSTDGAGMNNASLSDSAIETKFKNSKAQLEAAGFEIRAWVTPASQMHEKFVPLLKKYYEFAFTVYCGDWDTDANGNMTPYNALDDDVYKLHRVSMESTSLERIKLAIDEAVENVGYLNFYAHDFGRGMDQTKLVAILEYVKGYVDGGKCIVSTVSDGFDYYYEIESATDPDPVEPGKPAVENTLKIETVTFTTSKGYYPSTTHTSQPYGTPTDTSSAAFLYSSPFEVKAGQTVIMYASFNKNIAGLLRTDASGKPVNGGQLLTGSSTSYYEGKIWTYTAAEDMYCVASNRVSGGTAPVAADQWTICIAELEENQEIVSYTRNNGYFYSSKTHNSPEKLITQPITETHKFVTSSVFEVKAGQTVIIYGCFNSNMAGLMQTDASGNPLGSKQLLTGDTTIYETKIWSYTATEDMYCAASTKYGTGYLPSIGQWIIMLQDAD